MTDLTDLDRQILDLEGERWNHVGAKEAAIRERTGMTTSRYFQLANAMLDRPEALVYAPMTVRRLQRLRDQRRRLRPRSLAS